MTQIIGIKDIQLRYHFANVIDFKINVMTSL